MDADEVNAIELDRDRIYDRWLASDTGMSFRTWLESRPVLQARWEAGR